MNLILHPRTTLQLDALKNSSNGSVIFHGPQGIGKYTAAVKLTMSLNCLGHPTGICLNCHRIQASNFADLIIISREDKASIAVDQVRKLITDMSLRPAQSATRRVVIIQEAQTLTLEAQNALLKLLEEPPPATLIILLAEQLDALIPTIRSRCRRITFIPPGEQVVAAYLREEAHMDEAGAKQLAAATNGLPGSALALRTNPEAMEALTQLNAYAASTLGKTTFERLLLAGKLISNGGDIAHYSRMLQREISTRLATGTLDSPSAAKLLDALETFRRQQGAKVAPRVALERLMLELGR